MRAVRGSNSAGDVRSALERPTGSGIATPPPAPEDLSFLTKLAGSDFRNADHDVHKWTSLVLPARFPNAYSGGELSVKWKDQGWGNQKGHLWVRLSAAQRLLLLCRGVTSVNWSADCRKLLAGYAEQVPPPSGSVRWYERWEAGRLCLWDVNTQTLLQTMRLGAPVLSAQLHPLFSAAPFAVSSVLAPAMSSERVVLSLMLAILVVLCGFPSDFFEFYF